MQHHWLKHWMLVYTIIAVVLFILLSISVALFTVLPGDVAIIQAVQSFRSPWLDLVMTAIGLPGSPPQTLFVNALVILIVFLCRLRPEALTLLIFIPGYGTIGTLIRCGIDRPRPFPEVAYILDPNKDRGCRFPSGHTANFIVMLGFLIYVGLILLPSTWHRNLLLALYSAYIVLMGVSRIYVADHWPSDVLGGVLLGSIFLVCMIAFYEWVRVRFAGLLKPQKRIGP
jgi:undecaprenyl-diphosphatase